MKYNPDVIPDIVGIGIQIKVFLIVFQALIEPMQPVIKIPQVIQYR